MFENISKGLLEQGLGSEDHLRRNNIVIVQLFYFMVLNYQSLLRGLFFSHPKLIVFNLYILYSALVIAPPIQKIGGLHINCYFFLS